MYSVAAKTAGSQRILYAQTRSLCTWSKKELILNNRVNGCTGCYFKSQDHDQDVLEPMQAGRLAHNCETEEVERIHKICVQKNKTVCQQMSRVANQVSATAKQQQAANGNQYSILDFTRTALKEIVYKLRKAFTIENVPIHDADKSAEVHHCAQGDTPRQVYVKTENKTRKNSSRQLTMF